MVLGFIAVLSILIAIGGLTTVILRSLAMRRAVLAALQDRERTVNRLLTFSQTIQGAGRADQVFDTLADSLHRELNLTGAIILAHDRDAIPATAVKAAVPNTLIGPNSAASEMEAALCPCLRQNLPRSFSPGGTSVRCALDGCLSLPATHAAHCIPFHLGRLTHMVHMLLPVGERWDLHRCQLAQTYVNSAHAALSTLHLLSEAEKQSMTDPLTGLYNRRSLESLLQREVALAERHGHPLSIVMLDMDHFKIINDTHGHAAGDHLLKSLAECIGITLRKTDLAFRFGGDEFVIALPQTPLNLAEQVVQKLRQAFLAVDFSDAIAHLDHNPTLSIGVAERSKAHNVMTLPQLLGAADQALYTAKNANRNCIRIYPPQAA